MYYLCPNCYNFSYKKDYDICPNCGYDIKKYKESNYVNKLIKSLNHKSGDIQNLVLDILVQKKVTKSIPAIKKLLKTTKNPLLKTKALKAIEKLKEN